MQVTRGQASPDSPSKMTMEQMQMIKSTDKKYNDLMEAHLELMKAHRELLASHKKVVSAPPSVAPAGKPAIHPITKKPINHALENLEKMNSGKVGIVRLDGANYSAPKYGKKQVLGDAASAETWAKEGMKVFYQRPEGYTFTVCKYGFKDPDAKDPVFEKEGCIKIKGKEGDSNHMFIPNRRGGPRDQPRPRKPSRTEPWIEKGSQIGVCYIYDSATLMRNLHDCVDVLVDQCKVDCITSACGFMANTQSTVASVSPVPCLMSSLNLLPIIDLMSAKEAIILVLTANSHSFADNYSELIKPEWDIPRSRIQLVGLQDVEGFGEEVAAGTTVDVDEAEENISKKVGATIEHLKPKRVSCILSECTELPGYTNTLRLHFDIPVFDAITAANVVLNGLIPRDQYTNDASYG